MLTRESLLSFLKTEDFKSVNILKLEGLQITSCFKLLLQEFGVHLYLLSLRNNSISELDIKLGFSSLHKLDLSTNFLSSIGTRDLWESMPRLQILYLHDNLLETWSTLESLSALPAVLHLTLFNNPCIHLTDYRKFMISKLQSLKALDFYISTEEERIGMMSYHPERSKIWIQDTLDIRNFKQHIYKLVRKWERSSPVIRIQSLWRRYKVRKHVGGHFTERDKKAVIIQKHVRGWLMRKRWKKDLEKLLRDTNNEYLLYTPEDFVNFKAVKKIEEWYRFYKQKRTTRKIRHTAAVKLQSAFKKFRLSKIKVPLMTHLKFFVLKSQQRTLISLVRALSVFDPVEYHPAAHIKDRNVPEFFQALPNKNSGISFPELFSRIKDCKSIKVVRFPDVDSISYTGIYLNQLVKWVPHTKLVPSCIDRPLTDVPISSMYCSKPEFSVLSKFKNRGCSVSRSVVEAAKNVKYKLDDYLDFLEFEGPDEEFMVEFFHTINRLNKYLNQKDLPLFIPIYDVLAQRVKAACMIQAAWRGLKVRRVSDLGIRAICRRAAICIQRWWRLVKYNIRLSSLSQLRTLISSVNSSTIYMEEHFFQTLSPVETKFLYIEQDFTFSCDHEAISLLTTPKQYSSLLPKWIGTQLHLNRSMRTAAEEERTLQAALLSGTRVEVVTLASQINEVKVADPNIKFLKIEYPSIEEAKKRVAVLFLKTWNFKTKSAVPIYTLSDLKQQFLMSKLRAAWVLKGISQTDPCPAVQILTKALITEGPKEIVPMPPPSSAPVMARRPERIFEIESDEVPKRKIISSQDHLRKRVQKIREDSSRRNTESRAAKLLDLEAKVNEIKEAKTQMKEIFEFKQLYEQKQIELKRNLAEAETRKKQILQSERKFIVQFSQAKNMLQKLMKNSDLTRWKNKSREDVRARVQDFKNKSRERKEYIESMMYERYKNKNNKTDAL